MAFFTFKPESSSVIKFLAYDSKKEALAIQFHSDSVWIYLGVSLEVYDELISAKSVGNYFNKHIRNMYESERFAYGSQLKEQSIGEN